MVPGCWKDANVRAFVIICQASTVGRVGNVHQPKRHYDGNQSEGSTTPCDSTQTSRILYPTKKPDKRTGRTRTGLLVYGSNLSFTSLRSRSCPRVMAIIMLLLVRCRGSESLARRRRHCSLAAGWNVFVPYNARQRIRAHSGNIIS